MIHLKILLSIDYSYFKIIGQLWRSPSLANLPDELKEMFQITNI